MYYIIKWKKILLIEIFAGIFSPSHVVIVILTVSRCIDKSSKFDSFPSLLRQTFFNVFVTILEGSLLVQSERRKTLFQRGLPLCTPLSSTDLPPPPKKRASRFSDGSVFRLLRCTKREPSITEIVRKWCSRIVTKTLKNVYRSRLG